MLWMKIQDGGRRDERCGFKHVSTGEKNQLSISVSISNVLGDRRKLSLKTDSRYAGTTLSTWPVIWGMCLLSFVYRIAKTFSKSRTVSLFSSLFLFTRKIAAITAAMATSSSAAIFVSNVYSCQDRASRRAFFYANKNLVLSSELIKVEFASTTQPREKNKSVWFHLCPEMHAMTKMADLAKELHNWQC